MKTIKVTYNDSSYALFDYTKAKLIHILELVELDGPIKSIELY